MFDIALLIVFGVMAYRTIQAVRNEAQILAEFKQSQAVALLAVLFPLGPLVLFVAAVVMPFPLAFVVAAFCYLPALIVSRQQLRILETAGTDRVQKARAAATQAFGTALVGLIYVAISFAFTWGAISIA
jgi:hypothetical protein